MVKIVCVFMKSFNFLLKQNINNKLTVLNSVLKVFLISNVYSIIFSSKIYLIISGTNITIKTILLI